MHRAGWKAAREAEQRWWQRRHTAPNARSSALLQGEWQRRVTPPGSSHLAVPPPVHSFVVCFSFFSPSLL